MLLLIMCFKTSLYHIIKRYRKVKISGNLWGKKSAVGENSKESNLKLLNILVTVPIITAALLFVSQHFHMRVADFHRFIRGWPLCIPGDSAGTLLELFQIPQSDKKGRVFH